MLQPIKFLDQRAREKRERERKRERCMPDWRFDRQVRITYIKGTAAIVTGHQLARHDPDITDSGHHLLLLLITSH